MKLYLTAALSLPGLMIFPPLPYCKCFYLPAGPHASPQVPEQLHQERQLQVPTLQVSDHVLRPLPAPNFSNCISRRVVSTTFSCHIRTAASPARQLLFLTCAYGCRSKSIGDMSALWRRMDVDVQLTPMPPEYRDTWVSDNVCGVFRTC